MKKLEIRILAAFAMLLAIGTGLQASTLVSPSPASVSVTAVIQESLTLSTNTLTTNSVTLVPNGQQQCLVGCNGGANPNPIAVTTSWNLVPGNHGSDSLELCAYWSSVNALSGNSGSIVAGATAISTTVSGTFGSSSPTPLSSPTTVDGSHACGTPQAGATNATITAGANVSLWKLAITSLNANTTSAPPSTNVSLFATPATNTSNGTYTGTLNFLLVEVQ